MERGARLLWRHFEALTIAIRSPKERISRDCSPLLGWVPREGDLRTIGREGEAHQDQLEKEERVSESRPIFKIGQMKKGSGCLPAKTFLVLVSDPPNLAV